MLSFDVETTAILDASYLGSDITARRQANLDEFAAKPDETVLDLGCGNGLLTVDLAHAVGPAGQVFGVDPSDDMLTSARARCDGLEQVKLLSGSADALPLDDASVDGAVSVQVFEYLPDIPAALTEMARVLRPGGRLTIGDQHFGSWIWSSDDTSRMEQMKEAWAKHCPHLDLPAPLPAMLELAGFEVDALHATTFCDHTLRENGLANMMIILMEHYAATNNLIDTDIALDWAAEQRQRAAEGRFFFSLSHFVLSAHKR